MLASCVKFNQTAIVVWKNSFRNYETGTEMGRLIFRGFQCEMELDYITASRLLLVPVVNVCESTENWFQLIYPNLSWLQYCVLLPCVWLRHNLRKWFAITVLTLPRHALQPQNFVRIFCNGSEAIFCVFKLFSQEVKYFYRKKTWVNLQIIFIQWKWFKIWNNFGKEFASEGVEAAYIAGTIFIF